jgi:hypothetical protein
MKNYIRKEPNIDNLDQVGILALDKNIKQVKKIEEYNQKRTE